MKLAEIQKIGKRVGISMKEMRRYTTKARLIKAIQRKEGNFDCFGTATNNCDQLNCLWRKDCLKIK